MEILGAMLELSGRLQAKSAALSIERTQDALLVSIARQRLWHLRGDALVREYICSTSVKPPSNQDGSNGTPLGLHCVAEKFGEGAPPGTVFKSRRSIGATFHELDANANERNLITSRIFWLRGLEPGTNAGTNVDSHARYIYIHGCNHEDRLGAPQSAGCIELSNADVIALFDKVPEGTLVWIEAGEGTRG